MMIRTIKSFWTSALALMLVLLFLPGCKSASKEDPSPSDQMKSILTSGTWNLQTVTVDGVDKTSTYSALTLAFTATTFSSTNGRVVWPSLGNWQFSDETGRNIKRGDDLSIAIGEATTSKLVLSLTWNKTTFGRVESVKGAHVFTFTK